MVDYTPIQFVEDYNGELGPAYVDGQILYPEREIHLSGLPEDVDRIYRSIFRVRSVDVNSCAVLIGRLLEIICKRENARGGSLSEKLNYLANNGQLPKTLVQMADQLRQLRNLGAHVDEDEIQEEDVPVMIDFVEAILEYLYVAPAKIEVLAARLNKKK